MPGVRGTPIFKKRHPLSIAAVAVAGMIAPALPDSAAAVGTSGVLLHNPPWFGVRQTDLCV